MKTCSEENYIHYNIKPKSILLSDNYDSSKPIETVLGGFHLIKQKGILCYGCTPNYEAPELFYDPPNSSIESDIFSFGSTAYECFSRTVPFEGINENDISDKLDDGERPNLSKLEKDTRVQLIDLIKKCWSENETLRPKLDFIIKELLKIQEEIKIIFD